MFHVLLHPVADLRPLLRGEAVQRLGRPLWPAPSPGHDFLRSSGLVRPRLQGGTDEWAGEDNFADASLALRLPDKLRDLAVGDGDAASSVTRVFRRFYSSGIVSRYEIGLRVVRQRNTVLDAAQTAQWLAATAGLTARMRHQDGARPLVAMGSALATHYLDGSTDRKAARQTQAWWVAAGEPALLVEYKEADAISPLPHARAVSSARVGAEVLHHAWLEIAGQRVSTWMLRSDHPGSDADELRKLRIHLVRLHCERECLRRVLEAASLQRLGTTLPQAEELRDYLEATLPLLTRPVSHGVEQSQLLEVARSAWDSAFPGQQASFDALGQKVARQVARYIQRSETAAPVITQIIETQMNTTIQLGNVTVSGDFNLVTAQNIQGSFNKAAGADVQEPMKEALKALTAQVAELAKHLPPEQAETASKDLAALTAEAVSKAPRKPWYELSSSGLLEAAKTVAEMAAPVTTAVKAVLTLLA